MQHNVHIYAIVRVEIKGVEASTPEEAANKAYESANLTDFNFGAGEYSDDIDGFLVDVLDANGQRIDDIDLDKHAERRTPAG